ncbi:unnamed protein product, partial [Meganyctiphanes norvegica]
VGNARPLTQDELYSFCHLLPHGRLPAPSGGQPNISVVVSNASGIGPIIPSSTPVARNYPLSPLRTHSSSTARQHTSPVHPPTSPIHPQAPPNLTITSNSLSPQILFNRMPQMPVRVPGPLSHPGGAQRPPLGAYTATGLRPATTLVPRGAPTIPPRATLRVIRHPQ